MGLYVAADEPGEFECASTAVCAFGVRRAGENVVVGETEVGHDKRCNVQDSAFFVHTDVVVGGVSFITPNMMPRSTVAFRHLESKCSIFSTRRLSM